MVVYKIGQFERSEKSLNIIKPYTCDAKMKDGFSAAPNFLSFIIEIVVGAKTNQFLAIF
jgi:hypothetical protein